MVIKGKKVKGDNLYDTIMYAGFAFLRVREL